MTDEKVLKFKDKIKDIEESGATVLDEIEDVIYRLSLHDDLEVANEYKNVMHFLFKLKEAFKALDG